jgi:D-serine deaminase-like pyridoxal phosphate-dependent protein
MAAPLASDLSRFPLADYVVSGAGELLTPALLIYPDFVEQNLSATLALMRGDPGRWRPHIKTAKLAAVVRQLVARGITALKCATTLELLTACEAGAGDVLVAYPHTGANAARVAAIAAAFPQVKVSVLVESATQIGTWLGSGVGVFVDVNPGMDRTGADPAAVLDLAHAATVAGLEFRGVHFYDGQYGGLDFERRIEAARVGYERLLQIVLLLRESGLPVGEVITSGTPSFAAALQFDGWAPDRAAALGFRHRISQGTVVYNDATSLAQLPAEFGYRPAALVLARVVSHPRRGRFTCDAGHKTVSADQGAPTCAILGRPDDRPAAPSEEHLPVDVPEGSPAPAIGDLLYLLPRHVCPTVNNFDDAVIVRSGRIVAIERVTARGREAPDKARSFATSPR